MAENKDNKNTGSNNDPKKVKSSIKSSDGQYKDPDQVLKRLQEIQSRNAGNRPKSNEHLYPEEGLNRRENLRLTPRENIPTSTTESKDKTIFDEAKIREAQTLASNLNSYQLRWNQDQKIDKQCGKIYDNEKIDATEIIDRAKDKNLRRMSDVEITAFIKTLNQALQSAKDAHEARAKRVEQIVGLRAKYEIEQIETKEKRKLSAEEIWDLKNELLLKELNAGGRRRQGILFLIILLFSILLLVGIALGVWYYYNRGGSVSHELDGNVNFNVEFDNDSWYEFDSTTGEYKNKNVSPGDVLRPTLVVRNAHNVEGDLEFGDPIMLRFRAYLKVGNEIIENGLIVNPKATQNGKWYTYDKAKEDTYIGVDGKPIVQINDGWIYFGGMLDYGEALDLIDSITFNGEVLGNNIAGKTCDVVIEVQGISIIHLNRLIAREAFDVDERGNAVDPKGNINDFNMYWTKAPEDWIRAITELNTPRTPSEPTEG